MGGKRGSTGVSMGGRLVKRPRGKIDPNEKNCTNCIFLIKGICKKLKEVTGGKILYVSDKRQAKHCKYYLNKHLSET